MGIYYFLFIALSLCCVSDTLIRNNIHRLSIYAILVLCLIIFAGFRGGDPDWEVYSGMYHEIVNDNGTGFADIGFNFLCRFCLIFSSNPIMMFLSVAVISVSMNAVSMYRMTRYVFTALLLYFCHNFCLKEMIQIRVGLASAICLFSTYYLYRGRLRVFFILFVIAISIHLTSAIFIMAYVVNKYLGKRGLIYCVIISLLIGTFSPLGAIVKSFVGIDDRLNDYIAYGNDGYAKSLGIWSNLNTIKCLVIFGVFYQFYYQLDKRNKYFELLFKIYTVGVCWLICFNDFAIIGARMSNILLSVEPVLLTFPYPLFKKKSRPFYSLMIVLLAFLMLNLNIAPDKITPYKFYFDFL